MQAVPCLPGVKHIKTKWVLRLKEDGSNHRVLYKARLVVKGFLQRPEIDCDKTFAHVARLTAARTMLAVSIHFR